MAKASWKGHTLAEGTDVVVVEGNVYFNPNDVKREFLKPSEHHTVCGWKGIASYYDVVAGGEVNSNAAWYYPEPKPDAAQVKGRIAFWRGVEVTP